MDNQSRYVLNSQAETENKQGEEIEGLAMADLVNTMLDSYVDPTFVSEAAKKKKRRRTNQRLSRNVNEQFMTGFDIEEPVFEPVINANRVDKAAKPTETTEEEDELEMWEQFKNQEEVNITSEINEFMWKDGAWSTWTYDTETNQFVEDCYKQVTEDEESEIDITYLSGSDDDWINQGQSKCEVMCESHVDGCDCDFVCYYTENGKLVHKKKWKYENRHFYTCQYSKESGLGCELNCPCKTMVYCHAEERVPDDKTCPFTNKTGPDLYQWDQIKTYPFIARKAFNMENGEEIKFEKKGNIDDQKGEKEQNDPFCPECGNAKFLMTLSYGLVVSFAKQGESCIPVKCDCQAKDFIKFKIYVRPLQAAIQNILTYMNDDISWWVFVEDLLQGRLDGTIINNPSIKHTFLKPKWKEGRAVNEKIRKLCPIITKDIPIGQPEILEQQRREQADTTSNKYKHTMAQSYKDYWENLKARNPITWLELIIALFTSFLGIFFDNILLYWRWTSKSFSPMWFGFTLFFAFGWRLYSAYTFYKESKRHQGRMFEHIMSCLQIVGAVIVSMWFFKCIHRIFKPSRDKPQNQGFKTYKGLFLLLKGITSIGLKTLGILGKLKIKHSQHKRIMELFDDQISIFSGLMMIHEDGLDLTFQNQGKTFDEDEDMYREWYETFVEVEEDDPDEEEEKTLKEVITEFYGRYKYIIIGVTGFMCCSLAIIYYFRKSDKECTQNEGLIEAYLNEGTGKMSNKRKGENVRIEKREDIDNRPSQSMKKQQYDEMMDDKHEKQQQQIYSLQQVAPGYRWERVDRRTQVVNSVAPEKLMAYDHVTVRIGPFEAQMKTNTKEVMKTIRELRKMASRFRNPLLVKIENQDHWNVVNEALELNEANSLDRETFLAKARLHQVELTEKQLDEIMNAKHPYSYYSKLMLQLKTNQLLGHEAKNEGLLGMKQINTDEMASKIIPLHNGMYGQTVLGFRIGDEFITVAHGVYDIQLTQTIRGPVSTAGLESQQELLEVKQDSRNADWAILTPPKKKMIGSLKPYLKEEYDGPAFMIIPQPNGENKVAFGVAVVGKGLCWHFMPTVSGNSGCPIFNLDGEVIAMHKAYSGVANVAVPIMKILKHDDTPYQLARTQNQGVMNFSYLPHHMIAPINFDKVEKPSLLESECEVIGTIDYNFRGYGRHDFSQIYMEHYKDFNLPNPFEQNWAMAIPTIESIQKDFAKYTRKMDCKIDMARFATACDLFEGWIKKLLKKKVLHLKNSKNLNELFETVNKLASAGFNAKLGKIFEKGAFIEQYPWSIEKFLQMIENGENPTIYFEELGKEELRPEIKLLLGKIRSFNSGGIHCYAAERVVFGDLCEYIGELPFFDSHTTVGFAPYYGNWDQLCQYFGFDTPLYSDIDFPQWDSRFLPIIFRAILDIVLTKFDIRDQEKASIYMEWWMENVVTNAYCVLPIDDNTAIVVMIFRGMKSGCLVTFLFNCFGNTFRHFYVVCYMFEWTTLDEFLQALRWMACGDDFAMQFTFVMDMVRYRALSNQLGWDVESYKLGILYPDGNRYTPDGENGELTFAGCDTNVLFGVRRVPIVDKYRMQINIAIVKKGMTLPQFLQKMDNLIRIFCVTDIDETIKMIALRDFLVERWKFVPGVLELAQGFCTIHEALRMHDYIYEGIILNIAEPYKFEEIPLEFINQANLSKTNFKYHGNYCGPGWSEGKYQESVEGTRTPVDKLDQLCKEHDSAYARGEDLFQADLNLAIKSIFIDPKLSLVIGGQALLRKLNIMTRKGKKNVKLSKKEKQGVRTIARQVGRRGRKPRNRNGRFGRGGRARVPQRNIPIRRGGTIRGNVTRNNRSMDCTVKGEDYIGAFTTPSGTITPGSYSLVLPIGVESFGGTRLQNYFNMFEKWDIKKMSFWYEPVVATTEPGSAVMFVDPDPTDGQTVTGVNAVQKAMSAQGSKMFQVSTPTGITYKPEKKDTDRYTSNDSDDVRFSQFGNFIVVTASGLTASKTYGNLIVKYVIRFYKPVLEPAPSQAVSAVIYDGAYIEDDGVNKHDIVGGTTVYLTGSKLLFERYDFIGSTTRGLHTVITGPAGLYSMSFTGNFDDDNGFLDETVDPSAETANIGAVTVLSRMSDTTSPNSMRGYLFEFEKTSNSPAAIRLQFTFDSAWTETNCFGFYSTLAFLNGVSKRKLEEKERMMVNKQKDLIQDLQKRLECLEHDRILLLDDNNNWKQEEKKMESLKPLKTPPRKT